MKKIKLTVYAVMFCCLFCGCDDKQEDVVYSQDLIQMDEYELRDAATNNSTADITDNDEIAEDNEYSRLFYVVYVCGAVNNPGVYKLSEGSRVFDALSEAGGFTEYAADECINLAKLVSDEEMIYVPTIEELENGEFSLEASSVISDKSSGNNKKININSATKEELMSLPGVGESKANAIISYRQEKGKFEKIEDLMLITGIKEGLFNKVKDNICVK